MNPGPRRRHRPVTVLHLLVAACLALAGCSSLPTSGTPQAFDVSVPNVDPVDFAAGGPVKGTGPRALVQDFLLACAAGWSDDFRAARLFLSSSSASNWDPDRAVEVYATDRAPVITVDGAASEVPPTGGQTTNVEVSVPAVATLDEAGILARSDAGGTVNRSFHLVNEAGEWRIDAPDAGVLVSQASFLASHQRVELFFPSSSGEDLIGDPRWYPASRLASHLLAGLIAGPSANLAPAVVSAIPGGTTIPTRGVEVSDRVAHVTLEASVPEEASQAELVAWQVERTLTQVPSIVDVQLTMGGERLDTSNLPSPPAYSLATAIAVGASGLVRLAGTEQVTSSGALPTVGAGATSPAIGPVSSPVVAWTEGSSVLAADGATGRRAVRALGDPLPASVDRFGWVWTHSAEAGLTVFAPDDRSAKVQVAPGELAGLEGIRVSADGVRVLLLRRVNGALGAWTAVVRRDAAGVPVELGEALPLQGVGDGLLDASWAGTSELVLLAEHGQGRELRTLALGGFVQTVVAPSEAVTVSAGGNRSAVYVTDGGSRTWIRSGGAWQELPVAVRGVRFPG